MSSLNRLVGNTVSAQQQRSHPWNDTRHAHHSSTSQHCAQHTATPCMHHTGRQVAQHKPHSQHCTQPPPLPLIPLPPAQHDEAVAVVSSNVS